MKTLNERVNEVVKIAVSDSNALNMADAKKRIEKELSENKEYQKLVKAVETFKLNYYNRDAEYKEYSRLNLRAAFRAASKMVKGINIPFEYTDDDERVNKMLESNFVDTDARLASLICRSNELFSVKVGRSRKPIQYEEWTEEEKEQINTLVSLGILTEQEAKQKLAYGKIKK